MFRAQNQCLFNAFYRGKSAGDEGGVVSAAKRVEGDLFEPGVEVGLEEVHLSSHGLRSRVHPGSRRHIGGLVGAFTKRTNVVRISLATHDHYTGPKINLCNRFGEFCYCCS